MGLTTLAEERDEFMTYRILLALERRLAQRSVKGWGAQMGRVGRDKVNHAMKGINLADIGKNIIIVVVVISSRDTNLPGQSLNSGALGLPALLEQRAALEKQRLNEAMRANQSRSTIGSHDWENVLVLCGPAHVKDI
jgi:hypothetical protein